MKNLTTKLVRVMGSIKNVGKNGRNTFQNYDYVTEKDIVEAVREGLVKENVMLFSSVEGSQRDGDLTSIIVRHTFVDGDSGESFEVKSLGTGSDKQDKGAYKAYTGAMKYMLQKVFLLPIGDADPEATTEDGKSTAKNLTAVAAPAKITSGKGKYGFAAKPKIEATTAVEEENGF